MTRMHDIALLGAEVTEGKVPLLLGKQDIQGQLLAVDHRCARPPPPPPGHLLLLVNGPDDNRLPRKNPPILCTHPVSLHCIDHHLHLSTCKTVFDENVAYG